MATILNDLRTRKYLEPEEIAAILNVDKETIRRLLRDKKLRGTKVGRDWRIEQGDLERYLEANTNMKEQPNE